MGHIVHPDGTIKASPVSLFDQIASVARPTYERESHLERTCSHCQKVEDYAQWIYVHPASGCRLCEKCLSNYIETAIDENGKDEFEGFTFEECDDPWPKALWGSCYQVTNDEWISFGKTVDECVESVLMKLKLI